MADRNATALALVAAWGHAGRTRNRRGAPNGDAMKAVVCDMYGPPDVLHLEDVPRPEPSDDEVLVKVRAASVNRTDCGFRQGKPFFTRLGFSYFTTGNPFKALSHPAVRIGGTEFAGEVVS